MNAVAVVAAITIALQPARMSRTIEKGDQSHVDQPTQVVVRDQTEWQRLWQRHAPDRPLPAVDFAAESVVALFLGARNTAGYSVAVLSTTEANGVLLVRYKETVPAPGAIAAQVLTFPYHIVAIPKTSATRIEFDKSES